MNPLEFGPSQVGPSGHFDPDFNEVTSTSASSDGEIPVLDLEMMVQAPISSMVDPDSAEAHAAVNIDANIKSLMREYGTHMEVAGAGRKFFNTMLVAGFLGALCTVVLGAFSVVALKVSAVILLTAITIGLITWAIKENRGGHAAGERMRQIETALQDAYGINPRTVREYVDLQENLRIVEKLIKEDTDQGSKPSSVFLEDQRKILDGLAVLTSQMKALALSATTAQRELPVLTPEEQQEEERELHEL